MQQNWDWFVEIYTCEDKFSSMKRGNQYTRHALRDLQPQTIFLSWNSKGFPKNIIYLQTE